MGGPLVLPLQSTIIMLTRCCCLLLILSALLAAACSNAGGLQPQPVPDGGTDVNNPVDQMTPDGNHPDGDPDATPPEPLTHTQSFVVHGQLTLAASNIGGPAPIGKPPTTHEFIARIDPIAKTMLSSTPGKATLTVLQSSDGLSFRAGGDVSFALPTGSCGASVTYQTFQFTAGPHMLTGTASGTASVFEGDVGYSYAAALTFSGTPDTQGPSLVVPPTGTDPLQPVRMTLSEPLPATVTAHLAAGGTTVNLTPVLDQGSGVVTRLDGPDVALTYGTSYDVVIDPWIDLAGNAGVAAAKLITAAAPPIAAEDGFEGAATTVGGAMLIDASVLPPISGAKSALLSGPYGSTTPFGVLSTHLAVRLAVNAGDRFVRFSLRPMGMFQTPASTYNTTIRVAVPGGAIVVSPLPQTETLKTQQAIPNSNSSVWMGDVRSVEVALPAGVAGEVVFDVSTNGTSFACGLPAPTASYLLDDLRVE